jgi:rhodopsin domain-containing protein
LQCLAIVDFAFLLPQMHTTTAAITPEQLMAGQKYSFLAIPIWGLAMTFIKVSIAMTLLRIQPNNLWWRIFCGFIMFILSAYGIGNTFFILLQCRPVEASWNPAILETVGGSCLPPTAIMIASNTGAGVNISTDVMLSLAPIMFLWKLKRPLREKLVVGGLMALGLFASASSVIKTIVVSDFLNPNVDMFALGISIATWTMMEQLLAMIAASAPFLKPLLQSALLRFGVSLNGTSHNGYGASAYHRATGRSTFHGGTTNDGIKTTRSVTVTRKNLEGDESPFASNSVAFAANSSEEAIQLETRYVQHGPVKNENSRTKSWQSNEDSDKTSWVQSQESTRPAHAL